MSEPERKEVPPCHFARWINGIMQALLEERAKKEGKRNHGRFNQKRPYQTFEQP